MRKRIGKIIFLVVVIFLIGFICFYEFYILPQKNLTKTNLITVTLDGKNLNFNLLTYKKGDQTEYYLVYRKNIFSETRVKLTGFEDSVSLCKNKSVNLGENLGDVICFINYVGVHSQNLELISFKAEKLSPVGFVDSSGQESSNIFSDEPAIYFNDYNHDSRIDVIILNRDYDINPITDSIKYYYRNNGEKFIFDKILNITYDSN